MQTPFSLLLIAASGSIIMIFLHLFMKTPIRTRLTITALSIFAVTLLPLSVIAQGTVPAFVDVSQDNKALFDATKYLAEIGVIQPGGAFKPDDKITRAQVAKILVTPLVGVDQLKQITKSTFADVPVGQWYVSYVEAARALGIVSTAPTFNPNGPVTKAAFFKMLFTSKK